MSYVVLIIGLRVNFSGVKKICPIKYSVNLQKKKMTTELMCQLQSDLIDEKYLCLENDIQNECDICKKTINSRYSLRIHKRENCSTCDANPNNSTLKSNLVKCKGS